MARRQSWRSLSLRGLRKRKRRETALLIWRGTALKETKTRVRRDQMSLFDLVEDFMSLFDLVEDFNM